MHEIKRKIIIALRYQQGCTFSELNVDNVDSNKLAYHVKDLEKQRLITNTDSKYHLTDEGKRLLNFLCDETAQVRKLPVSVVLCLPVDDSKILMQERLKEPWYGYWMFSAGKVEFGESIKDTAERELLEETGLTGEHEYLGLISSRTYKKGKLSYHVHMYCYKVSNVFGELKERVKEGRNQWIDHQDVDKININPIDKVIFDKMHQKNWMIEYDQFFEDDALVHHELRQIH